MVMQKPLCVLAILDQSLGKHIKVTACAYTHSCTSIMILTIVIMFPTTVGIQHCILQPQTQSPTCNVTLDEVHTDTSGDIEK